MSQSRDTHPWQGAFRSYAGWVPNVRSHLSFSMIGSGKSVTTFTKPINDGAGRVVMLLQHRVVNDYPVPGCIAQLVAPDISLHWLLNGETRPTDIPVTRGAALTKERDRQGMLLGTIHLMARLESRGERKAQKDALSDVKDMLNQRGVRDETAVVALRDAVNERVTRSVPTISVQVALMRTGECRIWYPTQPEDVAEEQLDWVAQQAYYFVKDMVHDHTHHDETSDQITPLYRFGRHASEAGHDDEVAWRRETLWSLSREIERLNREGGLTDQRRSLGVIAYAEAFQASLMGHVRKPEEEQTFASSTSVHDYDFKHLKDSIKASIDVNAARLAQKIQIAIAAVATLVATMSWVNSLVSAHNSSLPKVAKGVAPGTANLGDFDPWVPLLARDPAITAGLLVTGLLVALTYFLVDGRAGIYNRAQRGISQFGRALAVAVFPSPLWQWVSLMAYYLTAFAFVLAGVLACLGVLAGKI